MDPKPGTKTDIRTPADLNSVTSDCDQVFVDLSSARSMRLLCILPNGPRLRAHVVRATGALAPLRLRPSCSCTMVCMQTVVAIGCTFLCAFDKLTAIM
jgi:hypothetical protein